MKVYGCPWCGMKPEFVWGGDDDRAHRLRCKNTQCPSMGVEFVDNDANRLSIRWNTRCAVLLLEETI
jgi:sarcosine oxidase delta subunit